MFLRIRPEDANEYLINLDLIKRVEVDEDRASAAASIMLYFLNGETLALTGEAGRKVLDALESKELGA